MIRAAQFAGSWYPGTADALRADVEAALPAVESAPAKAVVAPHAGYVYSLAIAAETYARVLVPEVAIVLCPNHRAPMGTLSVWPEGEWETPLGSIPVDRALVERVLAECPGVVAETSAHLKEHAVELHLPILQVRQPNLRLVAMVVAARDYAGLQSLGEGLARAIGERDDVLLVASTDMTHFKSADAARAQDERALDHVLRMDPAGLVERCEREKISMCGVRPTAAALVAAQQLGATQVELVRYGNSGETSGDYDRVVGYAGLVVR